LEAIMLHPRPFTGVVVALALASASAALAQPSNKSALKQVISTPKAPAAIGPYSQAVRAGNMVFLAGQIPIDPTNQQLMKYASIEDQTRLVLENLKAVLEAEALPWITSSLRACS
jgi:2-iminobutanoate/2-iminopropanoate deaminase